MFIKVKHMILSVDNISEISPLKIYTESIDFTIYYKNKEQTTFEFYFDKIVDKNDFKLRLNLEYERLETFLLANDFINKKDIKFFQTINLKK